jgi:enoyl-CoA hydratase/carnithine racemase
MSWKFMNELVKLTRDSDVAIVTIDNPPVNALSPGVPEGIRSSIESAAKDPQIIAVVVIGAGSTFIAGADIHEFGKITSGEKPREPSCHSFLRSKIRRSRSSWRFTAKPSAAVLKQRLRPIIV